MGCFPFGNDYSCNQHLLKFYKLFAREKVIVMDLSSLQPIGSYQPLPYLPASYPAPYPRMSYQSYQIANGYHPSYADRVTYTARHNAIIDGDRKNAYPRPFWSIWTRYARKLRDLSDTGNRALGGGEAAVLL